MITEPVLTQCLRRHWGLEGVRVSVHNGGMGSETWFVNLDGRLFVAKAVVSADGRHFTGGMAVAGRLEQAGIPQSPPSAAS